MKKFENITLKELIIITMLTICFNIPYIAIAGISMSTFTNLTIQLIFPYYMVFHIKRLKGSIYSAILIFTTLIIVLNLYKVYLSEDAELKMREELARSYCQSLNSIFAKNEKFNRIKFNLAVNEDNTIIIDGCVKDSQVLKQLKSLLSNSSPRYKFIVVVDTLSTKATDNIIQTINAVPNKESAIKLAVDAWEKIYGVQKIRNENPYKAQLINGVWHVWGSLPPNSVGGVANAQIDKNTGRILKIHHGK